MEDLEKFAAVVAMLIVAGIIAYQAFNAFVSILPWLLLTVAVIGAVWFFFWYQSTKRSEHPWKR